MKKSGFAGLFCCFYKTSMIIRICFINYFVKPKHFFYGKETLFIFVFVFFEF